MARLSPRESDSLYTKKELVAAGRYVMDDLAAGIEIDYFVE